MSRLPITVLVPTRNEEANVGSTLAAVRDLVDEIVVIDSESADATRSIAAPIADSFVSLAYDHTKIIPWIFQWALDHLPLRNPWVLLLEADQMVSPELAAELRALFAEGPRADGYYVRRIQVFRGKRIRFGGYGRKYLLKLFRRDAGSLDPREEDTRVYVRGSTARLRAPLLEHNRKEDRILFYLEKHLRYADAFAKEETFRRQTGAAWKTEPRLFGTPDQRVLWLKRLYMGLPLFLRPALYFLYRYVVLGGFLDGGRGFVFHFLQGFWFRFVVDLRIRELAAESRRPAVPAVPTSSKGA